MFLMIDKKFNRMVRVCIVMIDGCEFFVDFLRFDFFYDDIDVF